MENKKHYYDDWPYEDRRCYRCGKHIDELLPFGDLVSDDYPEGKEQKLFPNYRQIEGPPSDPEMEDILSTIREFGGGYWREIEEFYGPSKVKKAISYDERRGWWEDSMECRDCIYTDGYWSYYK